LDVLLETTICGRFHGNRLSAFFTAKTTGTLHPRIMRNGLVKTARVISKTMTHRCNGAQPVGDGLQDGLLQGECGRIPGGHIQVKPA
jgi:hypothetical protein